jgi:hypothetical protein
MNEKFDQLRAELARQDEELEQLMQQLTNLGDAGVSLVIPPDFFEAMDSACEVRVKPVATPIHAVRV